MLFRLSLIVSLGLAAPVFAGDAEKGEESFKKCKSCHSIIGPGGEAIVKGGKTGPNLFGIAGRAVASAEGFSYGDGILAAQAAGIIWDEENLTAYVSDPTAWLREVTEDDSVKSKMSFKLNKGADDIAAYLASLN
ncbi:c-type cytochrome [Sedimentimonas flavescens]|uniref:c-type cytochrome n=1 Tax=Sedimentimonas flavescens TaxID=2851012 RepID=UPI001C49E309|nr:c-type cytochrome [Sedimentimonas flavescens]MBW0159662.1 c-type cytochrome [Sedimentimonas flavescens]